MSRTIAHVLVRLDFSTGCGFLRREQPNANDETLATRLHEIKPHVSIDAARAKHRRMYYPRHMPREYRNNSPAVRMLERGSHVLRLGERLLGQMMKDTQVEQAEVQATKIVAGMDMKKFVRDTMARLEKSKARFSDIELMLQIFFCRHYDNFEIFLEELLGDIVRSEPELLDGIKLRKADDGLPAAEKLERRIEKVARLPLSQLAETARDEMSLEIFADQKVEHRLIYFSNVRNLLTHRHGIVDRHFAERHRESGLEVGKSLVVSMEFTRDAVGDMTKAAADIQARVESRFKLHYKTVVSGQTEWWEESYLPELPPPHGGRGSE